jgi:hypothetical protein
MSHHMSSQRPTGPGFNWPMQIESYSRFLGYFPPPHFHLLPFCLARWRDVSRTPVMYDTSLLSGPDRPPCSPGLVSHGIAGNSCAPACIFVCNVITMVTHLCGNDVWSRTERDLWVSASTVGRGHRGGLIQTSQWALD